MATMKQTIEEKIQIEDVKDERAKMNAYLDEYESFESACHDRANYGSLEIAILFHGYVTGGK